MDLNTATAADFEAFIGQIFKVAEIDDCELHLDRVEILTRQPESKREPFALLFKGTHAEPLAQQIYQLSNSETGALPIFLVAVGKEQDDFIYEAVFN